MSPIANPLVQGPVFGDAAPGGNIGAQPDDPSATLYGAQGSVDTGGGRFALGGGLTAPHNTSTQVAALVLASLAVIVLLHIGGFRFAVDAGLTGR